MIYVLKNRSETKKHDSTTFQVGVIAVNKVFLQFIKNTYNNKVYH